MLAEIHSAKQHVHLAISGQAKPVGDAPDFAFARQEYKHATVSLGHGFFDQARGGVFKPVLFAQGGVQPLRGDWITPSFGGDHRNAAHQRGHRGRIQRCGHHQQHKVVPQGLGNLKAQGEAKVGIQRALVKFIKNDRPDACKFRVGLDHPGQDTLGDDFDPGLVGGFAFTPHTVAHGPPDLFTQRVGHTFCGGPGREPSGLQHDDLALGQRGLEHRERNNRGFTGTGRCLKNRATGLA